MLQFAIVVFLFTGQAAALLDPGYDYVEDANTWLRLHLKPVSWHDARVKCQLEGGVLASPSNTALTKAMTSMMAAYKYNSRAVFIGIHDLVSKGDLLSLDGVPVTEMQVDWAHGEPSNHNDEENCLVLNGSGEVADVSCDKKHPYFCRKDNAVTNVSQECHTTHEGYEYYSRTGSCYKFHTEVRTWPQAAMVCHAEGGHLVIIDSDTEAQVIKEIFDTYPQNVIVGAKYGYAWIGVWKWNDINGPLLTLFGQPMDDAYWDKNQPNNLRGTQTSCTIQRNGRLNDIEPQAKEAFICEISVK